MTNEFITSGHRISICARHPGYCCMDPDCEDRSCPGRPAKIEMPEPLPDDPIASPEQVEGWTVALELFAAAVALAFLALAAVSVFK